MAVPIPLPAQKPCIASWNWMEDNSRRLMMPDIAFHRTSTRPPPPEVGAYPIGDPHHQLPSARLRKFSSPEVQLYDGNDLLPVPWVGVLIALFRAKPQPEVFGFIPDGPPARCSRSRITALEIYSSPRILSVTGKGSTSMGISLLGGGTWE